MTAEALAASRLSQKVVSPSSQTPINTSANSWLNLSLLSQQSNGKLSLPHKWTITMYVKK
jgi:hypothetical protein